MTPPSKINGKNSYKRKPFPYKDVLRCTTKYNILIINLKESGLILETNLAQPRTMKTIIALLLIIATLQVSAYPTDRPLPKKNSLQVILPTMMQDFTVATINKKTVLSWSITSNESARIFEVQRSSDGRYFRVAGIVMTSERVGEERYEFKEKSVTGESYYRIRLLNSNEEDLFTEIKTPDTTSDLVFEINR